MQAEAEADASYNPSPLIFQCFVCSGILERPVTLACGHSFCHHCMLSTTPSSNSIQADPNHPQEQVMVPICPKCKQVIWRPLTSLKQNVVIANLLRKHSLSRPQPHPPLPHPVSSTQQYHIFIECQQTNIIPMPHCSNKIVFTTAFMDQIIQQQSQTNSIILKWPGATSDLAIAARISHPEIYHLSRKYNRNETTFRAQLDGLFYVKVKTKQTLMVKLHQPLEKGEQLESPLTLCECEEVASSNALSMDQFGAFFNIYDQLNNPIYIRQIAQLVNEKVLNERNKPQALIYCILRVLKIGNNQLKELVQCMDDRVRWEGVLAYLAKNHLKIPTEVIRVSIPGNYPHELLFILIFLLVLIYYFTQ